MITQNDTTEIDGLIFTQESWEENGQERADIWVEDPENETSASMAHATQVGCLSNRFGDCVPLESDKMALCFDVMEWAYKNGLY